MGPSGVPRLPLKLHTRWLPPWWGEETPWAWDALGLAGAPGTPLSSSEQAHEDSRPFTDQHPPEHTDTRATESPWTAPREPTPASPAHIPTIAHPLLTPARRPARTPPCRDPWLKQGAHRAPATHGALQRRRSRGALPPHTRLLRATSGDSGAAALELCSAQPGQPHATAPAGAHAPPDGSARRRAPARGALRSAHERTHILRGSGLCPMPLLSAPQGWEVPSDPRLVCTGLQDKERPTWPPHPRAWEGKGWKMA